MDRIFMNDERLRIGAGIFITIALSMGAVGLAQDASSTRPSGESVFSTRCKMCHEPAVERAPSRAELAFRTPADIVTALTAGVMAPMAKGLSRPEIEAVALFLAPGQQLGTVGADPMCTANGPIKASASDWPALGPDENSTRFQANPDLRASDVPKLKVKWAFSMPGGGQPTVIGDWLFITNRGGKFYAFDAQSGKEIWHSESLEDHVASNITGTPVVSGNQLFVPLSSGEEVVAMQPNYSCCTFRGSLAALDLKTGQKQWQTYMITEPLKPTRINANGVQMQGPAGAPIWASPTVDAKRGLVYVVSGDSYTDATTDGDDAVVAIEMKTGKVRWRNQVTTNDNYIVGCSGPTKVANCPAPTGPDFDFGATPILF
jgi:polyvinyl alcohol dehydrogenase (cytochrome)